MWTVYDHPRDEPDHYVARRWEIHADGPHATFDKITSDTLNLLRDEFKERGLTCLPRSPEDEPQIVESWL